MQMIKNYIKNECGVSEGVTAMLLLVVSVASVGFVAYMIYNALKSGQKAMGEDFIQGG